MPLKITMLKAPVSVAVADAPQSIDEQGGTLGRGAENSWVLEDPELYLSSLHCQFSFEGGRYYLVDQSTNGTFYGGSPDPMGKGSRIAVNDNDRFVIGDYEFLISVDNQAADPFSSPSGGGSIPDDIFSTPLPQDAGDGFAGSPFAGAPVANQDPLFQNDSMGADPLSAIDKARGGSSRSTTDSGAPMNADPFAGPTHSDGANSLNQQIDWPQPAASGAGTIPDDWDLDVNEASAAAAPQSSAPVSATPELQTRQQELEQANAKMQAELDLLKQQINPPPQAPAQPVAGGAPVDSRFIDALGFSGQNLSEQQIAEINQLGGEVLREMISGLMQVLGSRSSIKNEFRMNVTTIQPVENNPLKFSANVDDALENMFLKKGNAFKEPIESVREGFEGVAEHQVAILAGIREAFKAVIGRFDPITLEESFAKQSKGGLLPGSQKAKNWEAYHDYYQELAGDIDKSFQYLFGYDFVRAYEEQLQKLVISRKSRQFDNEP